MIRAKFRCNHCTDYGSWEMVVLSPVVGDAGKENESFAKATPSGKLELTISNPDALGRFKPNRSYYLDISEAE